MITRNLFGSQGPKLVDVVFIGLPPKFHGSSVPGADVEIHVRRKECICLLKTSKVT